MAHDVIVRFYNRQSQMLHSAERVTVDALTDAVKAAQDKIHESHGEDVSAHTASVVDAVTGEGIPELDGALTKQQIEQQLQVLSEQLQRLQAEDPRSVPVDAPPVAPPPFTGPTPPTGRGPSSTEVSPSNAPRATSAPGFSQADIAAQQAKVEGQGNS